MSDINFDISKLAEVNISGMVTDSFDRWLEINSSFVHQSTYEFIHHLFPDETEEWYIKNYLTSAVPVNIKDIILKARRQGAARICFYA
jgi:hypothetical protein